MQFWLGTHQPHWLGRLDVPMFVSHRTLRTRRSLPVARGPWALDSGAFTEIKDNGRWTFGQDEYVEAVQRYGEEIGHLAWAAPMDWPSEPFAREKTGLSMSEHQERTVQSYLDLRDRGPFVPVLQGWELEDYLACADLYDEAGVDLAEEALVAVGSVCRRHSTAEIGWIMRELAGLGLSLHGFGVKQGGLERYGDILTSADSMAWSFRARHDHPLPGCTHKSCANCQIYAERWYWRIRDRLDWPTLDLAL
jgi:hypothetical protein